MWFGLASLAGCTAIIGDPLPIATDGGTGGDADPGQPDGSPLADGSSPDARPCVEGDNQVVDPASGHCYMYFSDPVIWEVARLACAGLGGHLATSQSDVENAIITPLSGTEYAWMAGNDIDVEGAWGWETGEPMVYVNWRDGEPNNSNNEDCMVIEGINMGLWDDRSCDSAYAFICERE